MQMLLAREPHPVPDQLTAARNGRQVCRTRGYCGPFINQAYYDAFPDTLWTGKGDCVLCGSTCDVSSEERARALRD